MCTAIRLPEDSLFTLGDLRRFFDVRPEDHHDDDVDDSCLCGVDVEAVLTRTGIEWWRDISGDWYRRSDIDDTDNWWHDTRSRINSPTTQGDTPCP